ncbi:MAG: MoxR family ATPase [Bacteroidetes bacterium]|nr:MoxR family ATPase [Bacteroidota bacterium]
MLKYKDEVEAAESFAENVKKLKNEIAKVIVGQQQVIDGVLISVFCKGHCLLEGVPGLAKTLLVKTISESLNLSFNRIQFTPDLMPSDITGSEILDENKNFRFTTGPLFANIILADEINRTPPKTQAALLEAMQEKTVTVGGKLHILPDPFFVLATQNPIEHEGTYPLPEAQLDRFMFKLKLDYPTFEEELEVVKNTTTNVISHPSKVFGADEIIYFQDLIRKVPVADNVYNYAVTLVNKTRPNTALSTEYINKYVNFGAGPRASQFLIIGAKCHALMNNKYSPDIENVQAVTDYVLRHRILINYKAEAEGITIENIIKKLI